MRMLELLGKEQRAKKKTAILEDTTGLQAPEFCLQSKLVHLKIGKADKTKEQEDHMVWGNLMIQWSGTHQKRLT